MPCIDTQRASVRRHRFDVLYLQAVTREHALDYEQRKIREMLMVDRVELPFRDEVKKVGEFDCDGAAGFEQELDPGDEAVEVGNMRQHVIGHDQITRVA